MTRVTWPATAVVGRAYLDQLARTKALAADRASAVRSALDRSEGVAPKSARATATAQQLESLASQLEPTAASAQGADKKRLVALADLLKAKATALR